MNFEGRSVLVVGGAGYIGSVLADLLLNAGATVRVLDQFVYDNGFAVQHLLDRPRIDLMKGDLRDRATIKAATDGMDDVVLLASLVGDPICKKYPELAVEVNDAGAKGIIDDLTDRGRGQFVFLSTCSNYGIHDGDALATETSDLNPQSLYARTKIAVEEYLLAKGSGFPGTVLRLATAYGLSPRMRFDLTVSQFTWELASGAALDVYDADTWRPYCHVRDISKAIMTVLTSPRDQVAGEVFNVGDTGQQFTKRMIVEEVAKYLPVEVAYREGDTDPRNYRVSFDKIKTQLDFRCDHTVQAYVPALVEAVQAGVFPDVRNDVRFGNYSITGL